MSCSVAFGHGGNFSDCVLPVCDSVKCRGWLPTFWRGLKIAANMWWHSSKRQGNCVVERSGKETGPDCVSRYDNVRSQLRFLFSFGTFRFRTLRLARVRISPPSVVLPGARKTVIHSVVRGIDVLNIPFKRMTTPSRQWSTRNL